MSLLLHFIFGFSTSFLGMVFPSMLNMTTVKINLERGRINAIRFAMGVGTMVLIQAYLAIFLIKHIQENPYILNHIQIIAAFIFAMLSIYFYYSFIKDKKRKDSFKKDCRNTFIIGLLLSGLNMFAIPFYYGITTLLNDMGLFQLKFGPILLFVIGSAIGSFLILYVYPLVFKKVVKVQGKSSGSINFILAAITGLLSLISLIKLL